MLFIFFTLEQKSCHDSPFVGTKGKLKALETNLLADVHQRRSKDVGKLSQVGQVTLKVSFYFIKFQTLHLNEIITCKEKKKGNKK